MSLKKIKRITEKYYATIEPYKEPVDILINPNTLEVGKLWNSNKIVRGWVTDSGDVYVWDGHLATHWDIFHELKIEGEYRIFIESDKVLGVYSDEEWEDEDIEEEITDDLINYIKLKPLLRFTGGDIKVMFGEYDAGGITEEYSKSFNHPRYDDLDVFKNPSRLELLKYLKEHDNMARFFIDDSTGDLYYWDGNILHEEMGQITGMETGKIKGAFHFTENTLYASFEANTLYSFSHKFDADDYYENPDSYSELIRDVEDKFENNKNVKRLGELEIDWER